MSNKHNRSFAEMRRKQALAKRVEPATKPTGIAVSATPEVVNVVGEENLGPVVGHGPKGEVVRVVQDKQAAQLLADNPEFVEGLSLEMFMRYLTALTDITHTNDWRDSNYLVSLLMREYLSIPMEKYGTEKPTDIGELTKADTQKFVRLFQIGEQIAIHIERNSDYGLIFRYHAAWKNVYLKICSLSMQMANRLTSLFFFTLSHIYYKLCLKQGKLLMGVKSNRDLVEARKYGASVLWVDAPAHMFLTRNSRPRDSKAEGRDELCVTTLLYTICEFAPYFTGDYPQAKYDALMFPKPQNWLVANEQASLQAPLQQLTSIINSVAKPHEISAMGLGPTFARFGEMTNINETTPAYCTAGLAREFMTRLAHTLGYGDEENYPELTTPDNYDSQGKPRATEQDLVELLTPALLSPRYEMLEGRPVVVKILNNELVSELILTKKANRLFARVKLSGARGEFMAYLDLHYIESDSVIEALATRYGGAGLFVKEQARVMYSPNAYMTLAGKPKSAWAAANANWSLACLIAGVYRDLVCADVVEGERPKYISGFVDRVATERKRKPTKKELLNVTAWQVIRRKIYVKVAGSTEETEELVTGLARRLPTEGEERRRYALRRYHKVTGHVRQVHPRESGWVASPEKLTDALDNGIVLEPGQTWINAHERNKDALEALKRELTEADLPHYIRKKYEARITR